LSTLIDVTPQVDVGRDESASLADRIARRESDELLEDEEDDLDGDEIEEEAMDPRIDATGTQAEPDDDDEPTSLYSSEIKEGIDEEEEEESTSAAYSLETTSSVFDPERLKAFNVI